MRTARRTVLGVWLAVTIAAAATLLTRFRIDNSVGVWFATDDPALINYRNFLTEFGSREWMLVAVRRTDASPLALASDRDSLAARLERLPHVHWVLTASDVPAHSKLARQFLTPDPASPYEALLLRITNDIETTDGYRETLVTDIRQMAEEYPTIAEAHVAGTAVINGELNRAARRDMFLFFPTVAVLLALIGGLLFRNGRDTAVLLSISLGTVTVTQGLLMAAGYPLNMITIMLPTVLIALSVADAIHLIHAFHAVRPTMPDSWTAAHRAAASIAWPCAGTTSTTIAGFLAFAGSSVVPVFQLAIFASVGIVLAWVLTIVAAPSLLSLLWEGRVRRDPPAIRRSTELLRRWTAWIHRHPRWVVTAFAVGGVSLLGLDALRADTDYVKFFRRDSRVPRDYATLQDAGFPQNPLNLAIQVASGVPPAAPPYWDLIEEFARQLDTLPGVHAVLSPFTLGDVRDALGDDAIDRAGVFSRAADQVQLVVMMDYPSSQRIFQLLSRIRDLADDLLPPDVYVIATGTSLLWANMDDGVIRTQRESLTIVSVTCLGVLLVLFRSLGLSLLGLALSLYPVAMVLGLMGLLAIPVNMATVLIAGIAVGLGVDDTIHVIHAYRERREDGEDRVTASGRALIDVGLKLVLTSVILVVAFAAMGLSDFMPTAQFGILSSITIILALAADLALLPVLLAGRFQARAPYVGVDHWAGAMVETRS